MERHFFRLRHGGTRLGPMNGHLFACARGMGRLDDAPVDADVAFLDQALDGATRNGWKFLAQESIETLGGERAFDDQHFVTRSHERIQRRSISVAAKSGKPWETT